MNQSRFDVIIEAWKMSARCVKGWWLVAALGTLRPLGVLTYTEINCYISEYRYLSLALKGFCCFSESKHYLVMCSVVGVALGGHDCSGAVCAPVFS